MSVSYHYETERREIFTESGQVMFIAIRDNALALIGKSGAATMGKLMVGTGSSWTMMACVHRLVELGELRSIWDQGAGQDEVFVAGPKWR